MSETHTKFSIKEITFSSDNYKLRGILHLPVNTTHPPVVIGSHGLLSSADSPKQISLAEALAAADIAYFRFDHRGCGKSEGILEDVTTLEARCTDLIHAIRTIRERSDTGSRIGLFGSSFGGAVCLMAAKKAGVDAVVTFAATTRGEPIIRHLRNAAESGVKQMPVDPGKMEFDILDKIAGIHHLLLFHGDSDRVIPPSEAHRIYQKAVTPKRLIMLRSGDHAMSLKENQEKFLRESVNWFQNSLTAKQPNPC